MREKTEAREEMGRMEEEGRDEGERKEKEREGQRAHSVRVLFLTVVVIRCQQLQVRI